MRQTQEMEGLCYYMIESLASGRSCYFESEEELHLFKRLLKRYMGAYVEIHRMYFSSEGYQILIKLRGEGVIRAVYKRHCELKGREMPKEYEAMWRIISERIRVFHSVYVKAVNRMRGREGVLVKQRYVRYYFESVEEWESYVEKMDGEEEIKGQRNERYMVSGRWIEMVRWGVIRSVGFVESAMDKGFRNYVVPNLIISTLKLHKPPT